MNDDTIIRKLLKALYLDYEGSALFKQPVTVKTKDRVLAEGKAEDIYSYPVFGENWQLVSITPNYALKEQTEYQNTPDWNLPKVIEVI